MPDQPLTPDVLDERVKASRELLEEKINNLDEKVEDKMKTFDGKLKELDDKYDRWATMIDDDIEKTSLRQKTFEDEMKDTLHEIELAQEVGERMVLEEAEKSRITKNRWLIGTVLAIVTLGFTIISEILLK